MNKKTKYVNVKLDPDEDQDIIEFLERTKIAATQLTKIALREMMKKKKIELDLGTSVIPRKEETVTKVTENKEDLKTDSNKDYQEKAKNILKQNGFSGISSKDLK